MLMTKLMTPEDAYQTAARWATDIENGFIAGTFEDEYDVLFSRAVDLFYEFGWNRAPRAQRRDPLESIALILEFFRERGLVTDGGNNDGE